MDQINLVGRLSNLLVDWVLGLLSIAGVLKLSVEHFMSNALGV